jgi:LPXTG-site transpeptidase (sortase) family protein
VWDRGNYGFVFQKLPKINIGESIKVIRDGNLYSYQVDHKVIKRPKDVSKELASRNDNSYLTLMACYPLLSDAQRILVRGKLIPIQPSAVAFSTNTANNL